jgi:ELWxxDGT repeat protein
MKKSLPQAEQIPQKRIVPVAFAMVLMLNVSLQAQIQIVKDINPGLSPSLNHSLLTNVDGTIYFVVDNRELWKSNGTTAGSVLVKAFNSISALYDGASTLYVVADDGTRGIELWKSNGTAAGTVLIKDIWAGASASAPMELEEINGVLYFSANDGVTGRELWKSNGTNSGTLRVKDILKVTGSSNPKELTAVNGTLYFTANNGQNGYELWRSNGTDAGTFMVKDIYNPSFYPKMGSNPSWLVNVNGVLMFSALNEYGRELWKSNGTAAGTIMVKDIWLDGGQSNPRYLTAVNGTVYFEANNGLIGAELWKSDGTAAGTKLVKDISPGWASASAPGAPHLSYLTNVNGQLYFLAYISGTVKGQHLWTTDGTDAGTIRLTEVSQANFTGINPFITAYNGLAYFAAAEGNNLKLFSSNGTKAGTTSFFVLPDDKIYPAWLTPSGGSLFFSAYGYKLMKTNGTAAGTVAVKETIARSGDPGSYPQEMTLFNSEFYFSAFNGTANGLWKSNGTTAGTLLIKNFASVNRGLQLSALTVFESSLYFSILTNTNVGEIWKSDGTTAGTVKVIGGFSVQPKNILAVNGKLYFTVGNSLYRSDGTAAGTMQLASFNGLSGLTNLGTVLFFLADDGLNGTEPWISNGTVEGTMIVKDIYAGSATSGITHITTLGNVAYFAASDGAHGDELWRSDGTAAGTYIVKDINTDDAENGLPAFEDVRLPATYNGMIYFFAWQGSSWGLWRSDGSSTGTMKITDLALEVGTESEDFLKYVMPTSTYLYFLVGNLSNQAVLWRTDGTAAGTISLKPVEFVEIAGGSMEYEEANGKIYVDIFPGTLVRSDGTACGTAILTGSSGTGIWAGSVVLENIPHMTVYNNTLYFAAETEPYGMELFRYNDNVAACLTSARMSTSGPSTLSEAVSNDIVISSYPNPFKSDFVLNVTGREGQMYEAAVFDIAGVEIERHGDLVYNTAYNIGSQWKQGLYLVKVKKENRLVIMKVIKE